MENQELQPKPSGNLVPPPSDPPSVIAAEYSDDDEQQVARNLIEMAKDPNKRGRHTIMAAQFLDEKKHGKDKSSGNTIIVNVQGYGTPPPEKKVESMPTQEGEWSDA